MYATDVGIFDELVLEFVVQRTEVVLAIELTLVAGTLRILVTSVLKFTVKSVDPAMGLDTPP